MLKNPDSPKIIEAQGWIVDANGDVIIVTKAPTVNSTSSLPLVMLGKLFQKPGFYQYWHCLSLVAIIMTITVKPLQAQVINTTQISNEQGTQTSPQPTPRRQNQPPSTQPLPEQAPPERLPPPEELLSP
ncbi:MAG: hypothetical protein ACREPR_13470, partial [Brasilonema sp.]